MGLFGESVTTLKRGLLEEVGNDTSLHVYEEKNIFIDNKEGEYLLLNISGEKKKHKNHPVSPGWIMSQARAREIQCHGSSFHSLLILRESRWFMKVLPKVKVKFFIRFNSD